MNNNIRNFAKESHLDLYGLGLDRAKWEAAMEKFAELIVCEAGEAFWSEACNVSDLAYEEYSRNSKKIKEHFRDNK